VIEQSEKPLVLDKPAAAPATLSSKLIETVPVELEAFLGGARMTVAELTSSPALAQAGRLGGGGGGVDVSLTRIVSALILCLMLAALAALLLKRSGGRVDTRVLRRMFVRLPQAARRIDVIETRRVSQYADVCLLRCDGREYLILCAQQQQTVLRDAPAAVEAEA
jgi:flagellar biogenesis protein FliO